jgi:phosphoribosylpyrophosphate synthetase
MTEPWSPAVDNRRRVAEQVRQQVGAIFGNVRRGPGICQVCTGPATAALCGTCDWHRRTYGSRLADFVVPLAYAIKGHQSGHHMYGYKGTLSSSADTRRDVKFVMWGAMYLHRDCISAMVGQPWSAVTFVSSQRRPGTQHPVVELAQQATAYDETALRFLLDLGPSIGFDRSQGPLPDRFVLSEHWREPLRGRHVLVVDDTWVAGRNSQSAAIALMDAGASAVTIVCVARWLDRAYGGHGELIDSLTGVYDALLCPVSGGACPPLLVAAPHPLA